MKISMASLALATLARIAVARNCDYDYDYCGRTLNAIGNYQSEMEEACNAAGTPCPGEKANDVLFDCVPGFTNSIKVLYDCASGTLDDEFCADGGAGKSDYCDFKRST